MSLLWYFLFFVLKIDKHLLDDTTGVKSMLFTNRKIGHLVKWPRKFLADSWLRFHPNEPIFLFRKVKSRAGSLLLSGLPFCYQRLTHKSQ